MRIVSLLPAATDTLVALGGADLLVGVSHACGGVRPDLPRVTESLVDSRAASASIDAAVRDIAGSGRPLYRLDETLIAKLAPDLIITQGVCDVCAVSAAHVHAAAARLAPSPRVLTLSGATVDGILADILAIGAAAELAGDAEELVAGLRARMRRVHHALKTARAPRPPAAVLEWSDPLYAAGHWVPEQVRRAGGAEVVGRPSERSRPVTREEIERADPEIVVVAPCGFTLGGACAEASALCVQWPWLRGRAVWAVDADALTSRPGPRVVDGIETLATIFAPALFGPPPPSRARRVILD